jgi:hypothetical protein
VTFSKPPFFPSGILLLFFAVVSIGAAAQRSDAQLRELVQQFREDPRGPYQDIRWFCSDGTTREARDPCPEEDDNNFQHARYKSVVKDIAAAQQIYFGQILTNSSERAFWDADDDHSRIKQYLLGNYLVAVDNGWILERARYYRGAIQVEDEEAWGQNFFRWLLRDQDQLAKHYFLIAQAARDVPHRGETDVTQRIRAVSRVIADRYPAFMDLRIKIHGRPSGEDAVAVSDFMAVHRDKLSELDLLDDAELLIKDIQQTYGGNGLKRIEALSKLLQLRPPEVNLVREKLENFLTDQQNTGTIDRLTAAAELSLFLREQLANNSAITSTDRMYLVDVNNELSDLVFREAPQWEPGHARERDGKNLLSIPGCRRSGVSRIVGVRRGQSAACRPQLPVHFPGHDGYLRRQCPSFGGVGNRYQPGYLRSSGGPLRSLRTQGLRFFGQPDSGFRTAAPGRGSGRTRSLAG